MELTEIMELTGILRALNFAHSPSGDEGDISAVIHQLARPWADEITSDVMGNLDGVLEAILQQLPIARNE